MDHSVDDYLKRMEGMKSARSTFEAHWEEIRENEYPSGDTFLGNTAAGRKAHQKVYDNTAEVANELLAAALHGMLTNPSTVWMVVRAQRPELNDIEAVALWLEMVTKRMHAVFNSPIGGFAPAQHAKYLDLSSYGTAGMFIAEDPLRGPLFQTRPLVELYVAEDDNGRIDTVYRSFKLAARVAVAKWGEAAGEKVVKAAADAKKRDDKFEFVHCAEPRLERDDRRLDAINMPFKSVYISVADKAKIREGGFPEWPYAIPRWTKRAEEHYGRGPGMKALPDVKMLQRAMKITIRGVEKIVDPPLMLPDDGMLSPARMTPSGMNIVRAEWMRGVADPIRPVKTGGRPDLAEDFMEGIRARIRASFHNNLLQIERDPRMTATQVIKISEEMLRVLGPVLGRLQMEDLAPVVDRTFAILFRAGVFGEAPAELEGQELEVMYVSPAAQAQRLAEASGIAQTIELMAPFATTNPEFIDNVDVDKTFRHAADLFGWPKATLRDPRLVAEMRQARAEAQAQEMAKEDMAEAGQVAAKVLPAIDKLTAEPPTSQETIQ